MIESSPADIQEIVDLKEKLRNAELRIEQQNRQLNQQGINIKRLQKEIRDASQRTLLRQREAEVVELKSAVEVIQSSRDILLNTFTLWTVQYQQGKMALREVADLRAQLAAMTQERDELKHFKSALLAKIEARGIVGQETDGDKELVSDCLYILLTRKLEQLAAMREVNCVLKDQLAVNERQLAQQGTTIMRLQEEIRHADTHIL